MNSIILHISDLHVSLESKYDGTPKVHNSFLSTSSDDSNMAYLECFISFIRPLCASKKVYLLVTGDITDWGEQLEFEHALIYLSRIVKELGIHSENILVVPGDHDINRRDLETLMAKNPEASLKEKNIAKFTNYSVFINNFLNKEFDPNRIICDTMIIDNTIRFIGINSSYNIDLAKKLGSISIEKFMVELGTIGNSGFKKSILCCHHNITSSYEDKRSGQWERDNRQRFIPKLLEHDINYIFSGNEHTSSLEKLGSDEITISDSGSFASKNFDSAFKIYELSIDDDIIMSNKIFGLVRSGNFNHPYHWEQRNNKYSRQDEFLKIFIKDLPSVEDVTEIVPILEQSILESPIDEYLETNLSEIKVYQNTELIDSLYDMVKELNAFHSGHFHWSETSRAHNWIDISKLIETQKNLNFLKNAVVDVLDQNVGHENVNLIIGLGYEGNILATKAALKYNIPYSFLPYSYRYHEHHKYETELNFDNSTKKYKNVLVITDVVNDGRTIRKLIKKRQLGFFHNVEKVYVISLFYTGESRLNYDILNFSFLKTIPNYDLESDEEVDNIEFYTVKCLKVEKCPYGKNYKEECLIYKDKLSYVNLFYDENKYLVK